MVLKLSCEHKKCNIFLDHSIRVTYMNLITAGSLVTSRSSTCRDSFPYDEVQPYASGMFVIAAFYFDHTLCTGFKCGLPKAVHEFVF